MEKFVQDNKFFLLLALGVIALSAVGVILIGANREGHRQESAWAFTGAETVEDYDQIISDFPKSIVGGNAMLRKAAILQDDGDVDEARIVLIDFLDSFPNHPLLDQGLLSLGSLFQEDGEAEKAKGY
ncbi:MAG: tetratricopeptide repeat protein, partial [Verrucomicrobiota bacterium]